METLTITNDKGTIFNYSKKDEYLIIKVTKNNNTNEYKTFLSNSVSNDELRVYRSDESSVKMPIFQSEKVMNFIKNRVKVSFNSIDEQHEFCENNNVGQIWFEDNVATAYHYV